MKYCEEFAALLDPYVDGELSTGEAARVREHLETCPGCRRYVDEALALRAAFPAVEETAVPEGFAGGVMEAVRELEAGKRNSKRQRALRWRTVLLPLAACFALVLILRTVPGGGSGSVSGPAANMAPPAAEDTDMPADSGAPCGLESVPQLAQAQIESDSGSMEEAPEAPAPESISPAEAPAADSTPAEPEAGMVFSVPTAGEKMSRMAAAQAIRLTAEEAGALLADLPYTQEEDGSRCYQLTQAEFGVLLETLAEQGITPSEEKLPETEVLPEGYNLVYVTEE